MTVILPNEHGARAKKEMLRLAAKLKAKYDIHFNREAHDEYEAMYGILMALDKLLQEKMLGEESAENVKKVIDEIVMSKGEVTAEGVYVWPKHAKDVAESAGIDWNEFKEVMKKAGLLEYDPKKRKYRVGAKEK